MKLVLLQDEPALLRGLEESLLRREGVRLLLAADGPATLEAAREDPASLAVVVEARDDAEAEILRTGISSLGSTARCLIYCTCCPPSRHASVPGLPAAGGPDFVTMLEDRLGVRARSAPRLACRLPAVVHAGSTVIRGRTRDLGSGGAFVLSRETLPAGEKVRLQIRGRGSGAPVEAEGHVARSHPPRAQAAGSAGMAIAFTPSCRLSPERVEALAQGAGEA